MKTKNMGDDTRYATEMPEETPTNNAAANDME